MNNKKPRQSNYTHVVTKLHPGDEVLHGSACLSNLKDFMMFYGRKMDRFVWPELDWWGSLDAASRQEKRQSVGLSNKAGLIKLAGKMLSKALRSLKSETWTEWKTDVPGFHLNQLSLLLTPPPSPPLLFHNMVYMFGVFENRWVNTAQH